MKKDRPVKVVFITSDNTTTSGAFLSMVKLISILREKGQIEPYVILPWKGTGDSLLTENHIPFRFVRSYPWIIDLEADLLEEAKVPVKKVINGAAVIKIRKLLRRLKPDLVHINTTWSYVGAAAAYAEKIPVVWHLREFVEEDQHSRLWNREKGYALIGRADHIAVISKALQNKYRDVFDQEKVHMIYNGIDVDRFYDGDKKIFQKEDLVFSCVGGLYAGKDQRLLIEACALLRDRGIENFTLNIVGTGPEEEALRRLTAERGLEEKVFFRGFCKRPEDYYRQSDMVFMVSRSEAFGRVTIEAMLSGCLVIGSDSGATTELIGQDRYGYLYEPGNAEALADTVVRALENKEASVRIMEEGRSMAREEFTAERNAEKIDSIYQLYRRS